MKIDGQDTRSIWLEFALALLSTGAISAGGATGDRGPVPVPVFAVLTAATFVLVLTTRRRAPFVPFLLSALAYGSLLAAVASSLRDRLGRVGAGLLLACVVGTVGVGLFVADPVATPMTSLSTRGLLHVITGTTAMVLLPAAALSINRSLARGCPDPLAARRLRWAGWLPLAGFAAFLVMLAVVVPAEGWPPRILFLTYAAWVVLLGRHLRRGGAG